MLTFNPDKAHCTGCAACYSACPTHCIRMKADEEGFLYTQYSSDGRCHLNAKGLKLWVDALLEYAQAQYDAGLWTPED